MDFTMNLGSEDVNPGNNDKLKDQIQSGGAISNEFNSSEDNSITKEPYVGMEFNSMEDAYSFYNSYALHSGFGIRKSTSSKSHVSGEIISKKFECDKSGFKPTSSIVDPMVKHQRETRLGCKAKLDIRRNKAGLWVVSVFVKDHNHELDTPRRAKKHRSHNQIHKNHVVKNLINQLHSSGMGPSKIAKTLNITSGCDSISAKKVSAHLKEHRLNSVGNEGALLYAYFQKNKETDPNFYFAIQLDINGILQSIFWADRRSRNDYFTFGDVLVFDVTYKTNKFMMPFAPFTGVNHHRQSILFGCALLSDESEESFVWLFKEWLKCMLDKPPKLIITDMDAAMYKAIQIIFPNTRHRFCSWHIGKHLLEHVHSFRDNDSDFKKDYYTWFNSKSVNSCEQNWYELVKKYEIKENSWLAKMWLKRIHWVPAYLSDIFAAGMTSSSRSESINSFFDGFVNSTTQLNEFIIQYEKALKSRRDAEEEEDYITLNSTAALFTSFSIEQKAAQLYTRNMFKLFQHEFKLSLECWYDVVNLFPTFATYKVGLSCDDKSKWCSVTYDESEDIKITCDCVKFETHGYLCKHILHVMTFIKHLKELPPKFILKRWTIDARNISHIHCDSANNDVVSPMMKWRLAGLSKKLLDQASLSIPIYEEVYETLNKLSQKYDYSMHSILPETMISQVGSNIDLSQTPEISIRDPSIVRTKGRPKIATRFSSGIEESQNHMKKRTCGSCGGKGHYATTCPNKLEEKHA